jgi:hypothetical protein
MTAPATARAKTKTSKTRGDFAQNGSATGPAITIQIGPRNATTDPATGLRYYRWRGRDLPSVTSIRRLAGIPFGLHNWAISKVVDRAVDEAKDVAEQLASADPAAVQLVKHRLRKAATDERDAAAELGTAVHDAAATGKALTDVPPPVAAKLRQYLDWLRVSGAEILASEFQCWNLSVGYAGTADLLCRFPDGSVWVVDIKTGKGIYGEYALQLMAYLMAEFVGQDDDIDATTTDLLRSARGVAVLHLASDHWEFVSLRADAETWTAFRGLLRFGVWMRDHEQRETFALGSRKGADQ